MRRYFMLSAGLHGLALSGLLAGPVPAAPLPDEPPRIEVLFGQGESVPAVAGAPLPPAPADGSESAAASAAPVGAAAATPGLTLAGPDASVIPARDDPGNHGPDYPAAARRQHLQGTVLLRLQIGADGAVTRVETLASSGVAELDAAAAAALATWHFLPARRAGQAVSSYRDQPVSFVLE